jgi:hypothetical protein
MPGGRPTKYDPAMCGRVVELGRLGAGRAEIALELDICRQTFANWENEHPEFLDATTRAADYSAGWWERLGRVGVTAKVFNAQAYSLQVRNRFPRDWRDKVDHAHGGKDGGPIEHVVTRKVVHAGNRIAAHVNGANGDGRS